MIIQNIKMWRVKTRHLSSPQIKLKHMTTIWKGKMEFWFEVLDAFSAAGINYSADRSNWTIKVADEQVTRANGILMEINSELEAGW